MSVATTNNKIALRVEDPEKSVFTEPVLTDSVQVAERTIAVHLNKKYLTDLEVIAESKTATNGVLEMTVANLGYKVLKGAQGIQRVKINGGKWCKPIDLDDVGKLQHPSYAGSASNPVYWLFDNKIHVSAGVTSPSIDVYFLRVPKQCASIFVCDNGGPSTTDIALADSDGVLSAVDDTYNGAVIKDHNDDTYHVVTDYTGSTKTLVVTPTGTFTEDTTISFITTPWDELNLDGVDSDFEDTFLDLILDFAEAECWSTDDKGDRSIGAYNKGMNKIQSLNAVYEKAKGIGTGTRKDG